MLKDTCGRSLPCRAEAQARLHMLLLTLRCACRWEPNVTHVVAPCLARNARILAAMAAGLWVVSWDLLDVSQRSRCLVEPVRAYD